MRIILSLMIMYFMRARIWLLIFSLFVFALVFALIVGSLTLVDTNRIIVHFFLGMMELIAVGCIIFFVAHTIFYERTASTLYLLWSKRFDSAYIIIGKFVSFALLLLCIFVLSFM